MAATAATIINAVAVECGLTSVANPYTSTDQNFILLRQLLNTAGGELLRSRDWLQFTAEGTFTGDGSDVEFDPPADFVRFIGNTAWNRTTDLPFSQPLSGPEWQALKATSGVISVTVFWRYRAGKVWFHTAPANGNDIKYEYLSKYWAGTSDGVGVGSKELPTAATDYVLLNEQAITRLLKVKWLQAKSLDSTAALGEYRDAYAHACAAEPAKVLDITGTGGVPLVGYSNIPDTGYGA